jgi:hypothetical protein
MISLPFLVLALCTVIGVFAAPGKILERASPYISSFWSDGTPKPPISTNPTENIA